MNKIHIFYHMFCVNDCTQRFLKTYFKIIQSGLFNKVEQINVILVGPQDNSSIKTQLQRLNKVKFFEKLNSGSEVETLNAIWQYSQVYDGYVLYFDKQLTLSWVCVFNNCYIYKMLWSIRLGSS